jgi:hypothetical protein
VGAQCFAYNSIEIFQRIEVVHGGILGIKCQKFDPQARLNLWVPREFENSPCRRRAVARGDEFLG